MQERIDEILALIDELIQGKDTGKLRAGLKWAFNGSEIV